jgi:hypothetical protein
VTQWLDATLEFTHDAPLRDLLLDISIFMDTAPNHSDLCELRFNDQPAVEARFWLGETVRFYAPPAAAPGDASGAAGSPLDSAGVAAPPTAASAPTARALSAEGGALPLGAWLRMGIDHILTGWDHLAFLAGLLVAAGGLAALLGVVTAFTLAHSITLALAALGLVAVPSRAVELLIAASIAWVGVANLLQRRPVARWKEAFGFGLVHGLGFAGFLADALAGETRRLVPLVGFNLGVEVGQLAVVVGVVGVLVVGRRVARRGASGAGVEGEPEAVRWLVPRPVRLVVSAGVTLAGLYWLAERSVLA